MSRNIILLLAITAFVVPSCDEDGNPYQPSAGPDTLTIVFRDGSSPFSEYFGARDAFLKDGTDYEARSANYGGVSSDTLGWNRLTDEYFERRFAVRFDISLITSCLEVIEAELTIHISPSDSDTVTFYAYEIAAPQELPDSWVEGTGDGEILDGICWNYASISSEWNVPGGDYYSSPVAARTVAADTVLVFDLPPGMVEDWIYESSGNDGVIIRSSFQDAGRTRIVHTREAAAPMKRPELVISYIGGG